MQVSLIVWKRCPRLGPEIRGWSLHFGGGVANYSMVSMADLSLKTCVVVKQIQSNTIQL